MAFLFRLETADGAPAEPPTLTSAVPNWRPGDTIPLGRRTLRVVGSATTKQTNRQSWWSRTRPKTSRSTGCGNRLLGSVEALPPSERANPASPFEVCS
jgi:hypothetical protein